MHQIAKIGLTTLEGDTMLDNAPKEPINIYLPPPLLWDIKDYVAEKKKESRVYSTTAFVEEAVRMYLMILEYTKAARTTLTPYELTQSALKTFIGAPPRK